MRQILIDGNHLASRVRHAQANLRTSDGRRSGVVFGTLQGISFVRNALRLDLSQVWIVWDGGRADYRTTLYPGYKQRDPKPTDDPAEKAAYIEQLEALRVGLRPTGVRQVRVRGCEADDLISVLVASIHANGDEPIVYSGDHDMHQLCDIAKIFDPKEELMGMADVLEFHGVRFPDEILLYKAIKGDDSDKIKGVVGIGDKLAKLALPYVYGFFFSKGGKTIEEAVQRMDKVKDKKTQTAIAKVMDDNGTVRRNLELMRLPRDWSDAPFYGEEQAAEFLECLDDRPKANRLEFVKFLKLWELGSIVDKLERW